MAVTVINLSDPVSTFVTKTNTVSSDVGDKAALTTTAKSNLVVAINEINTQLDKVDSADVVQLIKSSFQKDSANGIGFDSAQGRFFSPSSLLFTVGVLNLGAPNQLSGTAHCFCGFRSVLAPLSTELTR